MRSGGGWRGLQGHMHGETGCTGLLEGAGGLQGVRECMCGAPEGLWGLCKGTMRTARALHRVLQLSMCHPQPCLPCCSTALVPPAAEHN